MTDFLVKKFVKNSEEVKEPTVRENYGKLAGVTGIIVNLILFAVKLVASLVSGFAISVLADALNNLFDAGSSIVTTLGFKISGKEQDKDHPFGMGRFEYISGLIVSFIIIMVGFELFKESITKIFSPSEAQSYSISSIIIMAAAIFVKVWLGFFNKKLGKTINSAALKATASDSFCDCISTFAVLVGLVIGIATGVNLDGIIGALVAGFIMFTGVQAARETLSPLLGEPPEKEFVADITNTVMAHSVVIGVHDMIIHDYGPGRSIISLHAEVPSDKNILEIHDEIDNIEMQLRYKYNCDATIHMDPVDTSCELTNNLKDKLNEILLNINPALTFHDFRIVTGPTHTNLIFDVLAPFGFEMSDKEIRGAITRKVKELDKNYFCVIKIDKDYTATV